MSGSVLDGAGARKRDKMNSIKIFLTNGVTLTIKKEDRIYNKFGEPTEFATFYHDVAQNIGDERMELEFKLSMRVEDDKYESHMYCIPTERISWVMAEVDNEYKA